MIDVDYNFRKDSCGGDPDCSSAMLRKYHSILWSKKLPNGNNLKVSYEKRLYLMTESEDVKIPVGSDNILASYLRYKRMAKLAKELPAGIVERLDRIDWTIAVEIIFPNKLRDGKRLTINAARGIYAKIADRFDLSLEAIRRYYVQEDSPLYDILDNYNDFFTLFGDFKGYIDFFLLKDYVDDKYRVKFFLQFDNFKTSSLPDGYDDYLAYLNNLYNVVIARRDRIANYLNLVRNDEQYNS